MTETQSNVHQSLLTWKLWGESKKKTKKKLRKEIFEAEQETCSVLDCTNMRPQQATNEG